RRLRELAARAGELSRSTANASELSAEDLEAAREIARELERLASEAAPDADWRRPLEAARNAVETLLEADDEPTPADRSGGSRLSSGPEPGGPERGGPERGGPKASPAAGPVELAGSGSEGPQPSAAPGPEPPGAPPPDLAPADAAFLSQWRRALDEARRSGDG
ncbi:MAG: hypothetical protein AAFZ65_18350, partial [Planctomycetota bacterium]